MKVTKEETNISVRLCRIVYQKPLWNVSTCQISIENMLWSKLSADNLLIQKSTILVDWHMSQCCEIRIPPFCLIRKRILYQFKCSLHQYVIMLVGCSRHEPDDLPVFERCPVFLASEIVLVRRFKKLILKIQVAIVNRSDPDPEPFPWGILRIRIRRNDVDPCWSRSSTLVWILIIEWTRIIRNV